MCDKARILSSKKTAFFIHHATGDFHGETTESLVSDFEYPLHRHGLSRN